MLEFSEHLFSSPWLDDTLTHDICKTGHLMLDQVYHVAKQC